VQENDLGMFDQSKEIYTTLGSNTKSINHSTKKSHYHQAVDSNSLAHNSAGYPRANSNSQKKINLSNSKKGQHLIYDKYDLQKCYTQEVDNEENISK
jgi:hypothetical protein